MGADLVREEIEQEFRRQHADRLVELGLEIAANAGNDRRLRLLRKFDLLHHCLFAECDRDFDGSAKSIGQSRKFNCCCKP
jgi:hypothetical protein